MRNRVSITSKCLVNGRWFFPNQAFEFVEKTSGRNIEYKAKVDGEFMWLPEEYCTEIPDTLKLDDRLPFDRIVEDYMDDTEDYQEAYERYLNHQKPKVYSAETGKLKKNDEPITPESFDPEISRDSEASED